MPDWNKITGRTIAFQAAAGETVQFGSLQITEGACYTRPATEAPQTTTFVEVDEVDAANQYKRIFSGWMFAASPGLHGIEHPIYDIWLTGCKGGEEVEASPEAPAEVAPAPPENPQNPAQKPSHRPRRGQPSEYRAPPSDEQISEPPQGQQGAAPTPLRPPKNRATPGFNRPRAEIGARRPAILSGRSRRSAQFSQRQRIKVQSKATETVRRKSLDSATSSRRSRAAMAKRML